MVDPSLDHQGFGLSGRTLCLTLFAKYVGLTLYGLTATLVKIPTFVIVGSSLFAIGWAATVAALAALAAVGVARTWMTGRFRLEKWMTGAFVLVFLGYAFALVFRSIMTNDWGSAPLAIIPAIVCILPAVRFYSLVGRNTRRGKQ